MPTRAGSRWRSPRRCVRATASGSAGRARRSIASPAQIDYQCNEGVTTATIDLEPQDTDEYYNGYANRTLWPLFHYRIDLAEYERSFAGGYARVNSRFADTLRPLIEPDDLIWVHDYHLIPLGLELRRRECTNRMGFFLHIPWPPRRLLLTLPSHASLVKSLFAYDVIGFQTADLLDAFVDYVSGRTRHVRRIGRHHSRRRPRGEGHRLPDRDRRCRLSPGCRRSCRARRARGNAGKRQRAGDARSESTGSIIRRGSRSASWRTSASSPRIPRSTNRCSCSRSPRRHASRSSSYQEIRASLEAVSGRINGAYASAEWVPIRYVNQGYPRDELAAMYRAARIGLVTPLRDGMNLVAKEYVAAQDPDDPGVLILSRFAGSAEQLRQALLVNPYSAEDVADAIAAALAMPREERIARWLPLMANVEREDVTWWMRRFIAELSERQSPPSRTGAIPA